MKPEVLKRLLIAATVLLALGGLILIVCNILSPEKDNSLLCAGLGATALGNIMNLTRMRMDAKKDV